MIRVAMVDDHYVVLVGLKTILGLERDIEVVGEAQDGRNVVRLVLETKPDVLLLDVRMPGKDGIDALRDVLKARPDQKVVMLTTSDADNDIYRSLTLGAKGYLLKDRDVGDLAKAIRAVAGGGTFVPEAVKELYRQRQMMPNVTPREEEVLQLVVEGLGNDEIASRLGIASEGVKRHVHNLLAKFGVQSRVHLAGSAVRRGFANS